MNKIIFLDFDGTMIPTTFSAYMKQLQIMSKNTILPEDVFGEFFAPHCVENLKILVKETDARIVFSTKWKDMGFVFLNIMWKYRYDFGNPFDCTPILNNKTRGNEIDQWLKDNQTDKYVILDDMGPPHFHEYQLPYLVQCDERLGFTNRELEKALQILK